jgi:CheY-like chemotaxis protein
MADDSEDDAFFVKRALDKSEVPCVLHAVPDGSDAISYLRGEPPYANRTKFPFPNVLLCDLKMPKMNGFAVLRWLQAHPECKVIPTIIFTSSSLEKEIHQSYVLGANAYLVKPHSAEELAQTIQSLYHFWSRCQVPEPPPEERCC